MSHLLRGIALGGLVAFGSLLSGCGLTSQANTSSGGTVQVVAAENFWGSIASQIGGSHAKVTSIITDPNADPHSYQPTSQDTRTIADAQLFIENGVGYDPWADQLVRANPSNSRTVLNIGDIFGKKEGDNPHLWYNPDYITQATDKIRDDLKQLDSADASYFDQQAQTFLTTGLQRYHQLINDIKSKYNGTPVGSTESIFAYMAPDLGLDLITPVTYMDTVSEGTDISVADTATAEQQISQKQIKVLIYNSQNTPTDVQQLLREAKAANIPTPAVTETLDPAGISFQDWQANQLQGIEDALHQATGK